MEAKNPSTVHQIAEIPSSHTLSLIQKELQEKESEIKELKEEKKKLECENKKLIEVANKAMGENNILKTFFSKKYPSLANLDEQSK